MGCDTIYLYSEIFNEVGSKLRDILIDPTSIVTDPSNRENPYPIYESRAEHDADTTNTYKGILVWHARKYYNSISDPEYISVDPTAGETPAYSANAGFYVVPTFGNVSIRANVEFKQLVVLTFDSNADFDFDPYGSKISEVIGIVINNIYGTLEKWGNEMEIDVGRRLYTRVVNISKPISVGTSIFERRAVTIELRYCMCY